VANRSQCGYWQWRPQWLDASIINGVASNGNNNNEQINGKSVAIRQLSVIYVWQ